jgi:AcrR family transcriptional regulator
LNAALLDAAVGLAAEGGFEGVKQREVAARAGVALRTLYKRFGSKEELLVAGLAHETAALERRMGKTPPVGDTAEERLDAFFHQVTRAMCGKPNFARAVIRAMASGVPHVAAHVVAYQERMTALVLRAIRGAPSPAPPSEKEGTLAFMLLQLWFSCLVGWSASLFDLDAVDAQMHRAVRLLGKSLLAKR